ncbi:HNH endonuclease signature motif containing protein [Candidatus Blastococcus massiliensis]|uniref:HNH endonuclease signature motif containing protein n=1 Tax=Candidatus Blastococcus massiliensis TaxID=1470358 RepID=UPI00058BB5D7|nr:HNH endonuclease signature motif containing protein [Candidatus Blastococcus massiliensis]
MDRVAGTSVVEGMLIDWVYPQREPEPRPPVAWLDAGHVARELEQIQRERARQTAREAELILRLAELRPDHDDPPPGTAGGRRRSWRKTDPQFPGVSEFFPDELAHAINLGRGTAAFRARRAFTWRDNLPATFAALRREEIDERRAGVLAGALQHAAPELSRAVEDQVLPEACDLSPSRLEARALEVLAELDAAAIDERRKEAEQATDVRVYPTGDGRAALTAEMSAEDAAACYDVIDQLAAMAKAEGDPRPIGAIRTAMHTMLLLRPADHGLGGVTVRLTVTAALDGLEGASARGGEVNGFPITAPHLRELLARIGSLGLTTPAGGTMTFAITDQDGRLLATVTAADLARRAVSGCPDHPDTDHPDTGPPGAEKTDEEKTDAEKTNADAGASGGGQERAEQEGGEQEGGEQPAPCDCPVLGMPADTDAYEPRAAQRRFVTTRDRRCRIPNCGQRVGMADLDHVVAHAAGGKTSCVNLCCTCRSHHRLKTFARGWSFRMDPDGTLHVTSPSGITRTTRPPGLRLRDPERPPPDRVDDTPPF